MATTQKYLVSATTTTLLSTELNALANNSLAVMAGSFSDVAGATGDGSVLADLELYVAGFAAAPSASTGVSVWFLSAADGTNYEDGADGATTPARDPDVVFPVRAVATAQRVARRVRLPWGATKFLLKNDGTGQAFAATGNTLKIRPATYQGV